jgi:hypothetical protein
LLAEFFAHAFQLRRHVLIGLRMQRCAGQSSARAKGGGHESWKISHGFLFPLF